MERGRRVPALGGAVALVVAGMLAGSILSTPVTAHTKKNHATPGLLSRLIAHLNATYLNVGEAYTKAESDAKYLPLAGGGLGQGRRQGLLGVHREQGLLPAFSHQGAARRSGYLQFR